MLYATNPYSDSSGYLQMALGAYLTPSGGGYKSVDPYFLSQGKILKLIVLHTFCAIYAAFFNHVNLILLWTRD